MTDPYQQHQVAFPPLPGRCSPGQVPGVSYSPPTFRLALEMDLFYGQWLPCAPENKSHIVSSGYKETHCNASLMNCIHALSLLKTKQETQIGNISCRGGIYLHPRNEGVCLPGERSSRGDLASLVMIIARLRPTAW